MKNHIGMVKSMYYYWLYGSRVVSDLEFPQLLVWENGEQGSPVRAEIEIRGGSMPEEAREKAAGLYEFGRERSWLLNKTCSLVMEKGRKITYFLREGGKEAYLRTYILGWGMSMLALQRGELAIHCSAVARKGEAVLIAGESGSGKSTLTTAFLRQGYRLMADDMAIVRCDGQGGAWVEAAFPYQKLCRREALAAPVPREELIYIDEEKDKFLVPCRESFSRESAGVKAMLILRRTGGGEVETRRLRGMELFFACADNLFLRKLLGERKFEADVGQKCLELAACLPMYSIGRPEGRDTTGEVAQRAFECLDSQ